MHKITDFEEKKYSNYNLVNIFDAYAHLTWPLLKWTLREHVPRELE